MSYFRNVQTEEDDTWLPGKIYAFEVDCNPIEELEYPSSQDLIQIGDTYKNYWFSHGDWVSMPSPDNPDNGYFLPPFDWGWEILDILHERGTTRTGDGKYGPGSHWTGGYQIPVVEESCTLETGYYKRFNLFGGDDTLYGEMCGEDLPPANVYSARLLFDNNQENLDGSIAGLEIVEIIGLEDGWFRYTVYVHPTLKSGTYYLKGKSYYILPTLAIPGIGYPEIIG